MNFSVLVGRGIGPETIAPVLSAVSMMSFEVSSITLWSNERILIRIFCLGAMVVRLNYRVGCSVFIKTLVEM